MCGSCPSPLVGDGITCSQDHCTTDSPCFPGTVCYNLKDKAKCGNCPDGYDGNGVKCTPSDDPCSSSPCYASVNCINVRMGQSTGYVCGLCPEGMVGDGEMCKRTDACSQAPCYPGVHCEAHHENGSFSCGDCPPGLDGDGIVCQKVGAGLNYLGCEKSPCYPGVKCKNVSGEIQCGVCPPGMSGNGSDCQDIDDCSPNPCPSPLIGDGITCTLPSYIPCPKTVQCHPGVKCLLLPGDKVLCGPCPDTMQGDGLLCEPESKTIHEDLQVNTTSQRPYLCKRSCRNGGECVGDNKCKCRSGWKGRFCNKAHCPGGCRNKGKCVAPNTCRCSQGFSGKNCRKVLSAMF